MSNGDLLEALFNYNIDFKTNSIYLVGNEHYIGPETDGEPGVEFAMATKFIKGFNLLDSRAIKPITVHMKSCFPGNVKVNTDQGLLPIKDIKIGDKVLTHKGRYKTVTDTMKSEYSEDYICLTPFGTGSSGKLIMTLDHPVLIERDSVQMYVKAKNILPTDRIFLTGKDCPETGRRIPFNRKGIREPQQFTRGSKSSHYNHLHNAILPKVKELELAGYKAIPVGGTVVPDIIAIKEDKIIAVEVEDGTCGKNFPKVEFKQSKYNDNPIMDYIDDVVWYINYTPESRRRYNYDANEYGFIKTPIKHIQRIKRPRYKYVYNLTVEEDNTFVANNIVVHNCGGDWSEGMAIYDVIKNARNHVTILSYTHARSMSSIILQAADERVLMPNSTFMYHMGTCGFEGTTKQFMNESVELERTHNVMMDIYADVLKTRGAKYAKWSIKRIKDMLQKKMNKREEVYLTAEEAIAEGFADSIFKQEV